MSMWVGNCNGETLTQRIKDVMHELEVDGVARRNTLMELRYSVVTEAIKDGLYGGGRDPDTWLCANEVLQLMSGRGRLTEVVVGEKLPCTHCGCTHVTAQRPAMLVQLGLPEVGAPSIESMVHRWGDEEVLKDYRCPREECGLVRERREWRVLKHSLFVSTPNVTGFDAYAVAWWMAPTNRFLNANGLRGRFPEAQVDQWDKQGRERGMALRERHTEPHDARATGHRAHGEEDSHTRV